MVVWTSLPSSLATKDLPHAPEFHRVMLPEARKLVPYDNRINPSVRVAFPYAASANKNMPIDASVHFLLETQVRSSSGRWCHEQTASSLHYEH